MVMETGMMMVVLHLLRVMPVPMIVIVTTVTSVMVLSSAIFLLVLIPVKTVHHSIAMMDWRVQLTPVTKVLAVNT